MTWQQTIPPAQTFHESAANFWFSAGWGKYFVSFHRQCGRYRHHFNTVFFNVHVHSIGYIGSLLFFQEAYCCLDFHWQHFFSSPGSVTFMYYAEVTERTLRWIVGHTNPRSAGLAGNILQICFHILYTLPYDVIILYSIMLLKKHICLYKLDLHKCNIRLTGLLSGCSSSLILFNSDKQYEVQ